MRLIIVHKVVDNSMYVREGPRRPPTLNSGSECPENHLCAPNSETTRILYALSYSVALVNPFECTSADPLAHK